MVKKYLKVGSEQTAMKKNIIFLLLCALFTTAQAQETVEPIPFGNMEQWCVRHIKESILLGGNTQTLYVLGPKDTLNTKTPYDYYGKTIWGISNAWACVAGIDKAANTTQPERRGNGWCARLDTKIQTVRVINVINVKVCIAGTLFLGAVKEPVKDVNDPYGAIDMGIPFTRRPKAIMVDYKAKVNPERKVVKALGFSEKVIEGHDEPEIYIYLQKRWEDEHGNIHALRVGTARQRFSKTVENWENNFRINIHYGDITQKSGFKPYMDLFPKGGQFKARNSKGKMVKIIEDGWAAPDETPTHVILMVTAGCYPAFYGSPGNAFWVDNIRWVF